MERVSIAAVKLPEGRIVKLEGLWEGTPEITEEEIAQARREMWGCLEEPEI